MWCWIASILIIILNSPYEIKSHRLPIRLIFFFFSIQYYLGLNILSCYSRINIPQILHKYFNVYHSDKSSYVRSTFPSNFDFFPRSISGEHTNSRYSIGTFVNAKNTKKFNLHSANHWFLDLTGRKGICKVSYLLGRRNLSCRLLKFILHTIRSPLNECQL